MNASDAKTAFENEVRELAAKPIARPRAWIGGREWTGAETDSIATTSPIDGSHLADLPDSGTHEVDAAVKAAREAFERRSWSGMARRDRKRVLIRFADLILQNRMELGVLQTRDMGMPVSMAVNMDVTEAANCIRWYGEAIDKIADEMLPLSDRDAGFIARTPLGVIGVIIPWNFPLMIAAWKLGPALAMGNSIVMKPAEDATLAVLRLGELAAQAGLPEGVLNIVPGSGARTGEALALHMDVDCLTFTGSGRIGRRMLEYSAQSNMKRVSLECGGKTANIVFADAPNLDEAVQAAARAVFRNQGQICNAPTRLLVERPIYDDFVARVVSIAATLKVGNPLETGNDLGPVVNARQFAGIRAAIDAAETSGVRIALDGRTLDGLPTGYYLGPTIARDVDPGAPLAQEEVFGPVLSVIPFSGIDEAVSIANGTRYGLGASLWTRDIGIAHEAADRLIAGNIVINGAPGLSIEMPFGGFKESGFGRDRSLHALDKYSDLKAVTIRRPLRNPAGA